MNPTRGWQKSYLELREQQEEATRDQWLSHDRREGEVRPYKDIIELQAEK